MAKPHEIDMTEGRLLPKLLSFSLPLMLSSLLQLAFNAADLIVVGRFSGDNSLAAVGSTGALVNLIINVLLGIGTGAGVIVSRYFGSKNEKSLQETVKTAFVVAIVGGVIIGAAGICLSAPMLRLMGTPDKVLSLSALYLKIYFAGLPAIALYNFCSAILRAVGDTKRPLIYLTIAGVLNVLMNLMFVIIFRMDVAGVAIATVASQVVSCILTVRCLVKSDGIYRLDIKHLAFSKSQFKELLRIGLPAGIQGSLFSISNVLIQSSVNSFGSVIMAGNSAAVNIEGFIFVTQDAIAQCAMAATSQNMGARRYERIKETVLRCTLLEMAFGVVISAAAVLFRRTLVGIYTDEPGAIDAGAARLVINGSLYVFDGLMCMGGAIMRGHGYSILPTTVTLLGVCAFRILWIYTAFAASPSLTVLYISYPISWVLTTAVHYTCYFALRKRAWSKNEAIYHGTPVV